MVSRRLLRNIFHNRRKKKKEDALSFNRVDSMHTDIHIPLSCKSGDDLLIEHDGQQKKIKIPSGQQGKTIRVRMVSRVAEEEKWRNPLTAILCCA
mmetsp:Transcript_2751/g.5138  ORF Transcript_2751/g.5138 Transcript_2751/m.5138 type:complete len:95 (-) Transcript_2751:148-432(-)